MRLGLLFLTAAFFLLIGCKERHANTQTVTLYCSVDEAFARKVVAEFERQSDIDVQLITDSEAGKTTSLVQKLRLERERPRGDVFWSSEQSQTELLAREGVLTAYDSPAAGDISNTYRHPDHLWTGFALRARVIAYDPKRTSPDALPKTWRELSEPKYAKRLAVANPLFGTTRGHVSAMHALWGANDLRACLESWVANKTLIADGNSTAVRKLLAGDVDYAATDSDDVLLAQSKGHAIKMVFPDMGDGGTMMIPNTVALIANAPHPNAGRTLIDFLVSAKVERMLAESESGNYPVRETLRREMGIELPPSSSQRIGEIVDAQESAIQLCREVLLR